MANLNALIAQGAQFNIPNPVDQYSKVMQLQSAQQQMQLNRQQMQQIQEDRAGFAKLRAALAQKNLTPEQYRLALIDSPDPKMQQMGIELGLRQTRLDELDQELEKARGGGVQPAAEAPMAAPVEAPMAAPVAPTAPLDIKEIGDYRVDRNISPTNLAKLIKIAGQETFKIQPNEYFGNNEFGGLEIKTLPAATTSNNLAAQVAPAVVANALVAQPAAVAPVGNAMAAKQTQIAEINRKLDVLNSPRYSDLPGAKGRIDTLERQLKQLTESPFAKESRSNFTSASLAKFGQSGNPDDLVPVGKTDAAPDVATMRALGYPLTQEGYSAFRAAQRTDRLLTKEEEDQKARIAKAGATNLRVDAYVPASVEAQKQFVQTATDERKALRNAPDTIKNIEAAKKLIPSASTFMGTGGEPLLAAASFLNNRLGFGISTQGVTDATVLRTRLFEGILDNLKKLDSQPSQEQQRVLAEALGNLGTDPAALEQILDRIGETVRDRVDRFNADVTEAETRGVKFPFKPQLEMPARKLKPEDAAAQIPTGKAAATGGNVVTLPDGRTKTFPTAEAAAQFKKAAGL